MSSPLAEEVKLLAATVVRLGLEVIELGFYSGENVIASNKTNKRPGPPAPTFRRG